MVKMVLDSNIELIYFWILVCVLSA